MSFPFLTFFRTHYYRDTLLQTFWGTCMRELITLLQTTNWIESAYKIQEILKPELQGNKGLINLIKGQKKLSRSVAQKEALQNFIKDNQGKYSSLDNELNKYCTKMFNINMLHQGELSYDFIESMLAVPKIVEKYPNCYLVLKEIRGAATTNQLVKERLFAIVGNLVNQSLSQANKSLAGEAGESLVKALLGAAGLEQGSSYGFQFKTGTGSDTDFTIPHVSPGEKHKVKAYIAAQFSSNDRARMASSELGEGSQKYLVTGNGMDVSSKKLQDIGREIIEGYKQQNVKLVCRKNEIDSEIARLKARVAINPMDSDNAAKLFYLENYTFSMAEFANANKQQ